MTLEAGTEHVTDLIHAYVNNTAPPARRAVVRTHVAACPACRRELAAWRAVARATRIAEPAGAIPQEETWRRIASRLPDRSGAEAESQGRARRLARDMSFTVQLVRAQVSLLHRGHWRASASVMLLGALMALGTSDRSAAGMILALAAPLMAAISVAFVYGPENDPTLEITLSTPVSPRAVLMARLTLVFGYDLTLALLASAVWNVTRDGTRLWPLIDLWLGPMAFLSALGLLAGQLAGSKTAVFCPAILWLARIAQLNWTVSDAIASWPLAQLMERIMTGLRQTRRWC